MSDHDRQRIRIHPGIEQRPEYGQTEGIAAAKAKGVRLGRPRIILPEKFSEVTALVREGKLSYREAARELKVNYSWLYKIVKSV